MVNILEFDVYIPHTLGKLATRTNLKMRNIHVESVYVDKARVSSIRCRGLRKRQITEWVPDPSIVAARKEEIVSHESILVELVDNSGNRSQGSLIPGGAYDTMGEPTYVLTLTHMNIQYTTRYHRDYFDSLCELRQYLQGIGYQILCNGARIDAYPSQMMREFGGAAKVFIRPDRNDLTKGDIVDIFGAAPLEWIGTVEAQLAYYRSWMEPLL